MNTITVEITEDMVYIGEDNSSGCKYEWKNKKDIVDAFKDYVENYM